MPQSKSTVKSQDTRVIGWKVEKDKTPWNWTTDIPEGRQKAIAQGAMFFTNTTFSDVPPKARDEDQLATVHRWGDLHHDLDDAQHPENAQAELIQTIQFFCELGVSAYQIRPYFSGKKGFHLSIPATIFGSELGDPILPLVYKKIASQIAAQLQLTTIDLGIYNMGNGRQFRIPNVKRENGQHKIPLLPNEIHLPVKELQEMASQPRYDIEDEFEDPEPCPYLVELYWKTLAEKYEELRQPRPRPKNNYNVECAPWKEKHASKFLENCCAKIRQSEPGKQHYIRRNMAITIGGFVQYLKSEEIVMDAMQQAVRDSGAKDINAAMQTVKDGLEYGKQDPIEIPDMETDKAKDPKGSDKKEEAQDSNKSNEKWQTAREIAPRVPFPWHVLPPGIEQSLKQLARSCATSPTPLPGIAFAYLAAAIGRNVDISPKYSWRQPLIFWCADIRGSGEGKTPPMVALGKVFENLQKEEEERYDRETENYDKLSKEEKKSTSKPNPKRTYFLTDLTLESIVPSLKNHPTGGFVIAMSELSQFITSQNQYKQGKGSDRESWLKLHDGTAANLGRAGGNQFVSDCRVQLVGGIQPEIFRDVFGQKQYQKDGTNFRCLFTYDGPQFHEMTAESWTEENQEAWKELMLRAVQWSDKQDEKTHVIVDQETQRLFFDWVNDLNSKKNDLPSTIGGFLPKTIGYALRFAGILHCIESLMSTSSIPQLLKKDTILRGIELSMFYLGQAVDAMLIIQDEDTTPPPENTERTQELAQVLESLRSELDNGRLAVGYVREKFNEICKPEHRIKSPHAMGAWLRCLNLNLSNGKHDANGRRRARCLVWDESLENCLQSLQSLQTQKPRGFPDGDIEQTKSPKSPSKSPQEGDMETWETWRQQSLHPGEPANAGSVDNGDNEDNFSGSSEKKQYDFNNAPPQRAKI
ncbi:MAG: DUF3987 domain-containing protein [Desulfovermiculus sp.]|nr:DUF3987 domain-containing protein [Desulfovermiculus sp.]